MWRLGCVAGAEALVRGGASVTAKDYDGKTPVKLLRKVDLNAATEQTLKAILIPNKNRD